jgi:hypothetical protein
MSTDDEVRNIQDALMSKLTDRQLQRMQNPALEKVWSRKQITDAFLETFDLVGGVPRLALWANDPDNYAMFLKLMMTLAPKEAAQEKMGAVIQYHSNVPKSDLVKSDAGKRARIDEDVTDV